MWKEKINNSIANCYKKGNVVRTGIMLKSIITNMYEHIFLTTYYLTFDVECQYSYLIFAYH